MEQQVDSRPKAPCLICRARKVKCDRAQPACSACVRLEVQCPGYTNAGRPLSQAELSRSAAGIFEASGIVKRFIGSCVECRRSKCRCSRTRPNCERCRQKGLACTYPGQEDISRRDSPRSPTHLVSSPSHVASPPIQTTPLQTRLGRTSASSREQAVGTTWLNDDSIPQDLGVLRSLIDAYFDHVHPLRCLGFIHKPTFIYALERGALTDEYNEALIYIMCAFGAKYLSWDTHRPLCLSDDETEVPGAQWARKAREIAMKDMAIPSLQNLMALVLISEYGAGACGNAIAFVLAGCCQRLARLLGLDATSRSSVRSGFESCEHESRRRLMWSCFILDGIVGSGVDAHSLSKDTIPKIPLPRPESEFLSQVPIDEQELPRLESMESPEAIQPVDYRGQVVYLVQLRTQVLRLIRGSLSASDIQGPDSPFVDLLNRLESWYANVPAKLRITDLNMYILKELNMLGPVFALHLFYHTAVSDLTRVSLPGFNFPLAATFEEVSEGFRRDCQRRCRHHADEVSRLIGIGLKHGTRPFDDPFCFTAAYETTKIQIIHCTTTENRRQRERSSAEANIRCNTRLMTLMGRDGSHVHVRPLVALLHRFGFSKIALEWDPRSSADEDDNVEISSPVDSNHLSNVSILRMARAEMRRHESQSTKSPASQGGMITSLAEDGRGSSAMEQVQSPLLADRRHRGRDSRIVTRIPDAGEFHSALDNATSPPHYTAGLHRPTGFDSITRVSADIRQDYSTLNTDNDQPYNHATVDPVGSAGLFPDASCFLDASASDDFADDYAKLAMEMSDYITWNAADYTPWLPLNPDPTTQDTQNYVQHGDPRPSVPG
ncbi:Fungal specific transcription factor domain-containing protein [Cladophialophora immunda]|nr:Fungal specific transcription factor domain-containing protein [Cladophialophora immunda]